MWHDHSFSQKKQDIKNSSGGDGSRQQGKGVGQNFKKVGHWIQGDLPNVGAVRNSFPTMSHKELFGKKGGLIV